MGVVKSTEIALEGQTLKISNVQSVVISRFRNRQSVVIVILLYCWTVCRYILVLATNRLLAHKIGLQKVNLDLFSVDPELVEVCQTVREYFFHANMILVKKWVVPAYVTVTPPPPPDARLCW